MDCFIKLQTTQEEKGMWFVKRICVAETRESKDK